jgi:hypothetical protein
MSKAAVQEVVLAIYLVIKKYINDYKLITYDLKLNSICINFALFAPQFEQSKFILKILIKN